MSARRSTGVILIASGWIGVFIGIVLSATAIGAICGIPLIIISVIFMIWGYLMKAKDQEVKDIQFNERMLQTQAVASGVNLCSQCRTPNHNTSPFCSGCGYKFISVGDFTPPSVVDPIEFAHKSKQVKNSMDVVIGSDSPDS